MLRHGLGALPDMPLNPLDCFEDHFNVMFVIFYKQTLEGNHLRDALQKLLREYPLLTGRLGKNAQGKSCIKMNDAGVPFEETTHPSTLEEWQQPARDKVAQFGKRINPQLPLRSLQPVARVRLTHLKGGGSVLCTSFAHMLADGRGLCDFLRNWAAVVRGDTPVAPLWNRAELLINFHKKEGEKGEALLPSQHGLLPSEYAMLPLSFLGFDLLSWKNLARLYGNILVHLPFMTGLTLEMSAAQLAQIKEEANAGHETRLSLHEIISVWLLKLFNLKCDQKYVANSSKQSRLFMVADLRSRIPAFVGKNVFANVVGHVFATFSPAEIRTRSIRSLAADVREAMKCLKADRMPQQMSWLQQQLKHKNMPRVFASHNPFSPDLFISNCLSIPFYDIDFGSGQPYCFTMPTEMAPRIINIFPTATGEGCALHVNVTKKMARALLSSSSHETFPFLGASQNGH